MLSTSTASRDGSRLGRSAHSTTETGSSRSTGGKQLWTRWVGMVTGNSTARPASRGHMTWLVGEGPSGQMRPPLETVITTMNDIWFRASTPTKCFCKLPALACSTSANHLLAQHCRIQHRFLVRQVQHKSRRLAGPTSDWQPFNRVSIEEGPRRYDEEKCEGGAAEANPDGQLDVLQEIANEEGNNLFAISGMFQDWTRKDCDLPQLPRAKR